MPEMKSSTKTAIISFASFIATIILVIIGDPYYIAGTTFAISGLFFILTLMDELDVDLTWDNGDDA